MAKVRIRKLQGWMLRWFRTQARAHRRSPKEEFCQALTDTALRRKQEIAAELRADLRQLEERYGLFEDSAPLIRADRDTCG